eukprot:SAG11_NODE_36421_length_261_cov_1.376543_1_plen_34_part_10
MCTDGGGGGGGAQWPVALFVQYDCAAVVRESIPA